MNAIHTRTTELILLTADQMLREAQERQWAEGRLLLARGSMRRAYDGMERHEYGSVAIALRHAADDMDALAASLKGRADKLERENA